MERILFYKAVIRLVFGHASGAPVIHVQAHAMIHVRTPVRTHAISLHVLLVPALQHVKEANVSPDIV